MASVRKTLGGKLTCRRLTLSMVTGVMWGSKEGKKNRRSKIGCQQRHLQLQPQLQGFQGFAA
jgi:hypothetical protein